MYYVSRFLYIIKQIPKQILTKTAKELERMMGHSSFRIPYQTHKDNPAINTQSISAEMSSTFFSFHTFINCGSMETEVSTPAMVPIMFSIRLGIFSEPISWQT